LEIVGTLWSREKKDGMSWLWEEEGGGRGCCPAETPIDVGCIRLEIRVGMGFAGLRRGFDLTVAATGEVGRLSGSSCVWGKGGEGVGRVRGGSCMVTNTLRACSCCSVRGVGASRS